MSAEETLIEWRVETSADAIEAVADCIEEASGVAPAIYMDRDRSFGRASLFLESPDEIPRYASLVGLRIEALRDAGIEVGETSIQSLPVPKEDWSESWKRHFEDLAIGERLWIRASWSADAVPDGRIAVTLDPGLSFGTGRHATTKFCLESIEALSTAGRVETLLDVGCGSGLLAIAGARLGARRVVAFDNDPDAVKSAIENGVRNGLAGDVDWSVGSVETFEPDAPFDLVCANLVFSLVQANAERLVRWARPGGSVVVAGILVEQFDDVIQTFEGLGWSLGDSRSEGEWRSGLFSRAD